jgi:hypothetical protein
VLVGSGLSSSKFFLIEVGKLLKRKSVTVTVTIVFILAAIEQAHLHVFAGGAATC